MNEFAVGAINRDQAPTAAMEECRNASFPGDWQCKRGARKLGEPCLRLGNRRPNVQGWRSKTQILAVVLSCYMRKYSAGVCRNAEPPSGREQARRKKVGGLPKASHFYSQCPVQRHFSLREDRLGDGGSRIHRHSRFPPADEGIGETVDPARSFCTQPPDPSKEISGKSRGLA